MAGFGSGLVQGFQVGDAARARRVQEGRQAESDQWAREDRARAERERADQEAINAEMARAISMGAAQQPMPASPIAAQPDASGVRVAPIRSPGVPTATDGEPGALALESSAGPAQAARAGTEPQARQPVMQRVQTPDDLLARNRALRAGVDEAAKRGRGDLALRYQIEGMKLRDQLRQKASDTARSQYEATGDVGVFVPFVNEFMPGDVRLSGIAKEGEGYVLTGEKGGQPFRTQMKAGDLKDFISQVTNPDVQRALEAKRAEQLNQLRLEMDKKGPTVVPAGSTAVFQGGQTFTAPEKPEYKAVKNPDGSETLVRVDGGGAQAVFGGTDAGTDIPKPVRDMQKEARSHLFKLNGADGLNALNPENAPMVNRQQEMIDALISSSYGTDNWKGMSPALAASIAYKLTTMKPDAQGRPVVREYKPEGSNQTVRVVEYEGRFFKLDPFGVARSRPKAAPDAGLKQGASGQEVDFGGAVSKVGLSGGALDIAKSIFEQESTNGKADTSKPNEFRVRGPMQVHQDTFEGLKKQGLIPQDFDWANPEHNTIAGLTHIKQLYQQYGGDPRKVAAAYYAGEKAVGANGEIRDLRVRGRADQPTTLQYVDKVTRRLRGSAPAKAAAPSKPAADGASVSAQEAAGQRLDAARNAVRQAQDALYGFGTRQQRADPKGFAAAKAALQNATQERAQAEAAYQAFMPRFNDQGFSALNRRQPTQTDDPAAISMR